MTIYIVDHFTLNNIYTVFPSFILRIRKAHIDYVKNIVRKYRTVISMKSNDLLQLIKLLLNTKNVSIIEDYKAVAGDIIIYFCGEIYIIEVIERMI